MWGTYFLDVYRQSEARDMRAALEQLLGPDSGSGFSSGGVYVFWRPDKKLSQNLCGCSRKFDSKTGAQRRAFAKKRTAWQPALATNTCSVSICADMSVGAAA